MKRAVALVCAAAVAVTLAGYPGAQAAPAAPLAPAAGTFTPTLATWQDCDGVLGGLECSTLTVPLDYAHPDDGRVATIAVTRALATAATYQGVVLVNPGGPGGSGRGYASVQNAIPNGAGRSYDWIGFDPRGVGRSRPVLRCNSRYFGVNRPSFVPTTTKLFRFWLAKTRGYAQACGRSSGKAVLPYMTTRDVARDMESFRVAYQEQAPFLKKSKLDVINYYGYSYGTYLGQVYATLYPTKVGRFVMDGVVDPVTWWYGGNLQQERDFDRNLTLFFRWLAAHPGAFRLGTSAKKIRQGYYAQLRKLDKHPAAGKRLGPDELADAMLSAAYYNVVWTSIGRAYSTLVRTGNGNALFGMYASDNMGDDNGYAVYLGVQCSDVRRPTWAKQKADATRLHKRYPFQTWGNTWFNAPCLTWPAPSRAKVNVTGAGVSGSFLLISETLDAATAYSGALRVRSLFASSRLIAGVGGTSHAVSLSGVSCVDNRIAAFFANGSLPARVAGNRADVSCPKLAPPSVRTGARVSGGTDDRLSPALRAGLRHLG